MNYFVRTDLKSVILYFKHFLEILFKIIFTETTAFRPFIPENKRLKSSFKSRVFGKLYWNINLKVLKPGF